MERKKGKVILAGAGPGDADLITVKLQKRLADADIIITDRLVNPAIINEHASKNAEIIIAGKQGYNDASVAQTDITATIVEHAEAGKTVLRLKGGDTAFFSNILDELGALVKNEITFEIIPGITAASGASAYAGIPLTARGYATGVQFIAFTPGNYFSSEKWKAIATSSDTLVFYMAAKNIIELAEMLLRYSKKSSTALAVIEQATTIYQQVHITTLKDCAADFADRSFPSPSLVIVGDVVNLHKEFNWHIVSGSGTVFPELKK